MTRAKEKKELGVFAQAQDMHAFISKIVAKKLAEFKWCLYDILHEVWEKTA